jgi:hypothetical protein
MPDGALLRDAPARSFTLPVSRLAVTLAMPTGAQEMLLAESSPDDARLALALAQSLASATPAPDWAGLSVTDIDTLILRLRQMVVGPRVSTSLRCAAEGCGAPIDISFHLDDYLAFHHPAARPRGRGWNVTGPDETGWYTMQSRGAAPARFRPPTLADQIEAMDHADAAAWLARRCVQAAALPARARARVDAALAAVAPPLAGPVQGRCPECGAEVAPLFLARSYCLRELAARARFIYDDVDILAGRYHWPERDILALPHARRLHYAERARQAGAA